MSVQQFLLGETMLETALASGALGQRYIMQRLATPQGVEATQPSQEYPDIDARDMQAFTQWCDPERAMECLAEAMSVKYQDIDAMTQEQQWNAVRRSWRYFALYFKYMNLDIYAWDKFRRVMQQALGTNRDNTWNTVTFGHDYWDSRMGFIFGQQMPNTGYTYAYWRRRMNELYVSNPAKQQPGRYPDTATFAGIGNGLVDKIDYESHRLWIDAEGNVTAIPLSVLNSLFTSWPLFMSDVAGPASAWHTAYFGQHYVGSAPNIHLTMAAPLVWYWELLFGKVPGLRVGATVENLFPGGAPPPYQTGNYAAHQTAVVAPPRSSVLSRVLEAIGIDRTADPSGDLSLAEYLMKMGPAAMVMEVRRGVINTNDAIITWVLSHGVSFGSPTTLQNQQLDKIAQQNNQAATIAKMGMVLGASLVAIPTPGTIMAGAIIGLVSFVGGALSNVLNSHPEVFYMRDVFGRILDSRVPRDLGYLEFFRRNDPSGSQSSGLMSFLSYWSGINVANQDIVSSRRSLNEILKTSEYVRSVLGFPGWLDPDVFQGVPGYTGKPDVPVLQPTKDSSDMVLFAVLGGTAVVGVVGLALMKRETVVPVLAQGWQGTKDWAGRTTDQASALVRGRSASAVLPPVSGAAQT